MVDCGHMARSIKVSETAYTVLVARAEIEHRTIQGVIDALLESGVAPSSPRAAIAGHSGKRISILASTLPVSEPMAAAHIQVCRCGHRDEQHWTDGKGRAHCIAACACRKFVKVAQA